MDGTVDIKLLITLGGVFASIIGTAAVAKAQIQRLTDQIKQIENGMRQMDSRTDKLENDLSTQINRLDVIAQMMSPSEREKYHTTVATMLARLEVLERTQAKIESRVGLNGSNA
jgi:uncharacterized phage infection (PIP) family protein YhgE|tara:strand:+ start:185 stop:526 length:342 start_codon:yes stop_codon:yes gene_type:complete